MLLNYIALRVAASGGGLLIPPARSQLLKRARLADGLGGGVRGARDTFREISVRTVALLSYVVRAGTSSREHSPA